MTSVNKLDVKITSLEGTCDLVAMKFDNLIRNLKMHEIASTRNQEKGQLMKKTINTLMKYFLA